MKLLLTIVFLFLLSTGNTQPQKKYIKAGLMGLPLFQGGLVLAHAGFEYMTSENASLQLGISYGAHQVGADANSITRSWLTAERTWYLANHKNPERPFFFSLFLEGGKRIERPGYSRHYGDSVINRWNTNQLCPGIAVGKTIASRGRFSLQVVGGPKAIIGFHKDQYTQMSTRSIFFIRYSDVRSGFMGHINLCFQL